MSDDTYIHQLCPQYGAAEVEQMRATDRAEIARLQAELDELKRELKAADTLTDRALGYLQDANTARDAALAELAECKALLAECRVYVQTPLVYKLGTPPTSPELGAAAEALLARIDAATEAK